MKKNVFQGCASALITPFYNGKIDYTALGNIIERQIAAGIDALVIGGTTAEAATLSPYERERLYRFSSEAIGSRTKVIFGVGTNDTADVIRRVKLAEKIGCDGLLVVTPYYNRGTEEGVVSHYLKIASKADTPIILYNVPSRTGVNLSIAQLDRLSRCEGIVGIKEATDSLARFAEIAKFGADMRLYAGNDNSAYTALSLGGGGVISVLSNLLPKSMVGLCRAYANGDYATALGEQIRLLPIMNAMFKDTNPVPVKYAMSLVGLCREEVRLPLSALTEETKKSIKGTVMPFLPQEFSSGEVKCK